jgi:hypothetical protein
MSKLLKYATSYLMWIIDLAIAFWFIIIARNDLTNFLALFYKKGNLTYGHMVDFTDKVFSITLGLGWLALMIVVEEYYRKGVEKGDLRKRFARVTGPLVIAVFVADLITFWLGGIGSASFIRWLILAAELGIGIALIVEGRQKLISNPS